MTWLRNTLLCLVATLIVAALAARPDAAPASDPPVATGTQAHATVTIQTSGSGARLRAGFIGLGVVADTVASDQFAHTNLADYLRLLGPDGTLHIDGNRVDSFWTATGERVPRWSKKAVRPTDLVALAKALRGTDWRVVLGVPILHIGPARSAQEARYAKRILGSRLAGIEVGNEPNGYPISTAAYFTRFQREVRAITAAVPGVKIEGPATGRIATTGWGRKAASWDRAFTRDERAHPDIALFTTHEYPLTICNGQHPTIAQLLSATSERHEIRAANTAAADGRALGVPAAIDETNSVICWGAPGVSNTYASALWALDYGLLVAQHGVSAVNMQTEIAGCAAYIPLCTAPHGTQLFARPEFYGLLALKQMGTGSFLKTTPNPGPAQLHIYAVKNGPGRISVALDNFGPALNVNIRVPGQSLTDGTEIALRTTSPKGLSATDKVTLGGRRVGANARFGSPVYARVPVSGSTATVHLPAYTAAIVKLS